MATGGNEDTSDEIFDFNCSNCMKVNKIREAVKYCVECQGYCCQPCVDSHQSIPALIGHKLLDKSSFKSLVLTTDLPAVPTERCLLHRTKIVDFYCGNHDIVGCSSCMVLKHRSCSDVQAIPEAIDDIYKKTDVDETFQNIQEINTSLEKMKTSRQTLLQQLRQSKIEALNAIKEFRKEMESLLDKLEAASKKEVEDTFRKLESQLEEEKKRIEDEKWSMDQAADELRKAEGNNTQEFVCMKRAQEKFQHAQEISSSVNLQPNANISFVKNSAISDSFKDFKSFGLVETHQYPRRTNIYTIKATKEMNVRLRDESETCYVIGSCITEDGMLLLVDNTNKKLKRADPATLSVVDHCDLTDNPWGVCCISKQEAAVTLSNNTVHFVSLDKQMTLTRQIKLDHTCYGIAYKDGMLYISGSNSSVYIHDMTGKLVQTVSKDGSGNALFYRNRHLAVSDSGDKIFVADLGIGLVTLDVHGKHAHTLRDPDLSGALGVCTDRRGNVFVSGFDSSNVMQVAQDGEKKIGVIVKPFDGIRHPLSICFDSQNLTLFVTTRLSDIMKVFKLQ